MTKNTLIAGNGEVGRGLLLVLKDTYSTLIKDREDIEVDGVDYLHICFPYSGEFINECQRLEAKYQPRRVIIHSTVPVGTTRKCGEHYIFSPIRGKHPNLGDGIKTFTKYIAGDDLDEVEKYFVEVGLVVKRFKNIEALEFAKIMCTTRYGVDICFMKLISEICRQRGYDFNEVYTNWHNTYNDGYRDLGDLKYWRPILNDVGGKIGGHCVVPNCEFEDNWATKLIKQINENL